MSTEISAAHEHIELSHNLDIRFDLFHASDIYIMPHWHNALDSVMTRRHQASQPGKY